MKKKMIDEKNKTIYGVTLRPKQYKILSYIITRPNELITRQEILDAVWGKDTFVKIAVIDVHLSQIRRLIPELNIYTRSGFGFIYIP